MGLYEGIKDVAKVMQQADNIDLCLKCIGYAGGNSETKRREP